MIHHYNRLKSTTCITEITTQKNEKYLSEGRNSLAFLPAHLISTKKFLCEFTEKCFVVIAVKSDLSHVVSVAPIFFGIFFYHSFYVVWLQDSSQIKGQGYIFMSIILC